MKEKMEWVYYSIEERELLEEHLTAMSKQGWNILGMTANYILYQEAIEIKEYIVDICENPNKNDPYKIERPVKKQIEMYEEFGYKFVCNYSNFLIFESNGQERMIHTDEEIEKRLIEEARKKQRRNYVIIPTIIELSIILCLLIFSGEMLLFFLSSNAFIISMIVLIILNFTSIFIDNISNIVQKEKRPKFRFILLKIWIILLILCLLLPLKIFSPIYSFALIIGAILILVFDTKNQNKRIRGEINEGNSKFNSSMFFIIMMVLVNLTRHIGTDTNPLILSENITGYVEETIIHIEEESNFVELLDVSLISGEDKYRYEYYEVKDTFLKDFMFNLVLDKYPSKEYLYSICNTKIYRSEDRISHTYPIIETKILLVHENKVLVLNHKLNENREHLEKIIQELNW